LEVIQHGNEFSVHKNIQSADQKEWDIVSHSNQRGLDAELTLRERERQAVGLNDARGASNISPLMTSRAGNLLIVILVWAALAFGTIARRSLGPRGSTIAALIWLINAGIIEKGRLIEIEGLYVSLCALAIIFWLSFWEQKKSAWLIWTVPFVFLGLGWLAKGPVHLLFFYGVVIAVVWKECSWRALFHPAHFVGIAVMLGIFAAWAIPFLQATDHATATSKWSQQFTGRLRGTDFEFGRWIFNIPHGVLYLLPWVIFLPLARSGNFAAEKDRQLAKALAWGALVPFVVVDLVPGS